MTDPGARGRLIQRTLLAALGLALLVPSGASALPQQTDGEVDLLIDANVRLLGSDLGAHVGYSVADAGDINHDGIADVIVGAPDAANNGRSDSGSAYVVYGSTSPTDVDLGNLAPHGFRIDGAVSNGEAGIAVAGAGDVNGDGVDDVVVGARGADNNGAAYVVFGGGGGDLDLASLGARGYRIDGAGFADLAGSSVAGIGDANNDGLDDVAVGAPHAGNGAGAAYVVFGKTSSTPVSLGALGSGGFTLKGAGANDAAGTSVAGIGDLNGDHHAELILGAPGASPNGRNQAGTAYAINGAIPGGTVVGLDALGQAGKPILGANAGDHAGTSVAGVGDVDGDGVGDVAIGARGASNNGRNASGSAYVLTGFLSSQGPIDLQSDPGLRIDGAVADDALGYSLAGGADVNGDGHPDVVVGAPNAGNNNRNASGSAYVIYWTPYGPLDTSQLNPIHGYRIDGAAAGDDAGYAVAIGPDLNGDGQGDVIAGGPQFQTGAGFADAVFGFGAPVPPRPSAPNSPAPSGGPTSALPDVGGPVDSGSSPAQGGPPSSRTPCVVPRVIGKTLAQAKRLLAARHCTVGKTHRRTAKRSKAGRVIAQKPRAKTRTQAAVDLVIGAPRRGRR